MELVQIKNGEVMASSLDVAERFGKRHSDVLEKLEKIMCQPTENSARCFRKAIYVDAKGEARPMYMMNKDGFCFLVMGFTGKKADEWKWKFIEEFNRREQALLNQKNAEWIENRSRESLQEGLKRMLLRNSLSTHQRTEAHTLTDITYSSPRW